MTKLHIRIVGAGLIGTSIGLGVRRQGHTVEIADVDDSAQDLAQDLVNSGVSPGAPDLVVIATPPRTTIDVLRREFASYPEATFIDVASTKNKLLREVEGLSDLSARFIGTHPMAGREISGARSAQADLFNGRAWIVTPTSSSEKSRVALVLTLIESLGATAYVMSPSEHDFLMARISHLPQMISTSLAASLLELDRGLELSGQGLRDMTRIANSDGSLWSEILVENRKEVLEAIDQFTTHLEDMKKAISDNDEQAILQIFQSGNMGRAKVSGKHGAQPRNYSYLLVVIKDEPGALRQLFDECAQLNANIEDLSIEHSPQQETGLITLAFSPEDAIIVQERLLSKNWKVHLR